MPFWSRLLDGLRALLALRDRSLPQPQTIELDEHALRTLRDLAAREQREPGELARALLRCAIRDYQEQEAVRQLWKTLTPREQQVVALICMRYSNAQISDRLGISPQTVKTHTHNVLHKFEVENRSELRMLMLRWDFSCWEDIF